MKKLLILLIVAISLSCKIDNEPHINYVQSKNFLIVFGTDHHKDSLQLYSSKINATGVINVLKYCDNEKAFMCTIDSSKYHSLQIIDREVHNPAYNLPKCYVKQLGSTQNCN